MRAHLLSVVVLLVGYAAAISMPPVCMDLPDQVPYMDVNSTCGNGVVDVGEVCDDGNRIGGDGCNAWCNAFDRLGSACTMAGSMQTCSYHVPQLGTPSQTVFCDLTCVTSRVRNGVTTLYLADAGVLLQYDIMVSPTRSIRPFASTPMTTTSTYRRFCSLIAVADSDAIIAHECISQKVILFASPNEVAGMQVIMDLGGILAGSSTEHIARDFHDESTNQLLIASSPGSASPASMPSGTCSVLYAVSLVAPAYEGKVVAYIPCSIDTPGDLTLDGFTGLLTTYDADGMKPSMVFREQCTDSVALCYVVYMNRGDLHRMKVYVPVVAGNASAPPLTVGMKYVVNTNAMDNVLFVGMQKRYGTGGSVMSLVSSCLSVQPANGAPPFTFGDVCTLVNNMGWGCATPLRNPFPTDVVASPFMLPNHFSSGLTHYQLQDLFGIENLALVNATGVGGAFLYQQLLDNALSGTLPVDFTQVASTGDIVYITSSSVNVLSTKGMTLQDYTSFPYCLAHDATLCRAGYYGSVGGTCVRCPDSRSSQPTPAEQMMCVGQSGSGQRRLLTGGQMAPSVSFSAMAGGDVTSDEIDLALCQYMTLNCLPCSTTPSQISQKQPANGNADAALSSQSTASNSVKSLPEVLLLSYAAAVGMVLPEDGSEYSLTMAHPELMLINSVLRDPSCRPTPLSDYFALAHLNISAAAFNVAASACTPLLYRGAVRRIIRCVIQQIRTLTIPALAQSAMRRRSLLATGASTVLPAAVPRFGQQNDIGLVSSTPVNFRMSGTQPGGNNSNATATDSSSSPSILVIAIISGVSAAVLLLVIAIVVCVARRKHPRLAVKEH